MPVACIDDGMTSEERAVSIAEKFGADAEVYNTPGSPGQFYVEFTIGGDS